ncbi:alpha/beta fold hydrolase [Actinophytocola algeriensis]|jgi:pimeloyl-ACP methyl ester carboxylesterase|uniref:Pimeloyl-ACP methyl ester carboxylesterase n=1 Tax=Actinophytocola algeriensis TaxID=1768010 RepID=A0A7W7QA77_9PSEU|nr:alpha/beta fold hydrolase [Actinophytocola algeriensis]MBB4909902.1 pimeloyl-ACP methyl ester carboxylesterase [Actinophytocola algeriensis]MBE1475892.1 pimeloyl-ACP methyl ester carboxylesterase [Actinophytocola algeriensis]
MSEVRVDGLRTRYRVDGTGDPVVLLHGIARTHADWSAQHELLSDRFRVYSVDLAGFGGSDPLPGRYSLQALADFVERFLDAVGLTEPVHLVGNSLGGAVAMRVSVQSPERVRTLALVNSAGFGKEVTIALRLLAVRGLAALLLRPSRAGARQVERSLYVDRAYVTDERVEYGYRIATRPHGARVMTDLARNLGSLRGVRQAWRDELLTAVATAKVPTLVVWGDRDLILPAAHLEAARTLLPHARVHLFRDTGHMPQVERAEELSELLVDLWRS